MHDHPIRLWQDFVDLNLELRCAVLLRVREDKSLTSLRLSSLLNPFDKDNKLDISSLLPNTYDERFAKFISLRRHSHSVNGIHSERRTCPSRGAWNNDRSDAHWFA